MAELLLSRQLTQYSVGFARGHGRLESFVARKTRPLPQRCEVGSFVELVPQPEVQALAHRTIEAMDYFGIGEVEILRDDGSGECFLIEVNARPWIQYALAPAAGYDFIRILLGQAPQTTGRVGGRAWLSWLSDLRNAFSPSVGDVRQGRIALASYLGSLLRANLFSTFSWRDPAPAFPVLRRLPWLGRVSQKAI